MSSKNFYGMGNLKNNFQMHANYLNLVLPKLM